MPTLLESFAELGRLARESMAVSFKEGVVTDSVALDLIKSELSPDGIKDLGIQFTPSK